MDASTIAAAVARCAAWLDTLRGPDGYGGPVAHWWQNCLQYTGAGLDWRYEGIILGYLALHARTGDGRWRSRARRAGDDLVGGQLPTGNYRNSCFEQNPYPGGTPHEAACDLALLQLAAVLRDQGESGWQTYAEAAERNLRGYHLAVLWDGEARRFWDHPRMRSFVPNKAATLAEAWLALARLRGDDEPAVAYALPTLEAVRAHQVAGGPLDGAIYQYSQRGRPVARFFPYYVARCVPGLVAGYRWTADEGYLDAARRAVGFVLRTRYEDGSFPQVVYPGGRVNRYPQWVAGVGDVLRAMELVRPYGVEADTAPTWAWLLQGQLPSGGFRTAHGFASQVSQREPGPLPEVRDLLPVAGWSDKAFRALAGRLPAGEIELPRTQSRKRTAGSTTGGVSAPLRSRKRTAGSTTGGVSAPLRSRIQEAGSSTSLREAECVFRGQRMLFVEDGEKIVVRRKGEVRYRWRKGAPWAEVAAPEFWLK